MTRQFKFLPLMAALVAVTSPAAHAGSDCQPIFDAYAAQMKVPALRKIVSAPGMATPVEMIMTSDALYSRTGASDPWSKTVIDGAVRAVMKKGYPTAETVHDCSRVGPQEAEGIAGTAYVFAPSAQSGNVPGEKITVLIDDRTGLPVLETAAKAGTRAKIAYDGVTAPAP